MSWWCCGSILASNKRGGRFEPFYCHDKYLCHWIQRIQRKYLMKTQMKTSHVRMFLRKLFQFRLLYKWFHDWTTQFLFMIHFMPAVASCQFRRSGIRYVSRVPITNYLPHETIFQLRKFSSAAFFLDRETSPVLYSVQKQLINVISGKHNKTQFSQGCIWNIRIMFNILLIVSLGKHWSMKLNRQNGQRKTKLKWWGLCFVSGYFSQR